MPRLGWVLLTVSLGLLIVEHNITDSSNAFTIWEMITAGLGIFLIAGPRIKIVRIKE